MKMILPFLLLNNNYIKYIKVYKSIVIYQVSQVNDFK